VLVTGIEDLERWVPHLHPLARRLAERFWPGPLTIVVPTAAQALRPAASPLGVGFRCSPHPRALALVEAFGGPIASTSANRAGEEPCRTAEEVATRLGAALPVVGGEPAGGGLPSTVVAVSEAGALELLREGATPFGDLREETRR
jgi:L-threonylcarbamoyladenylate synthase